MRVLVLGGTVFVGRTIVEELLRSGVDVTIFGRGRTGNELFPEVPRLLGDRDVDDYASLRGGEWDAVIDASGYVPRHVAGAMDALDGRVGRYVFLSSHAVYQRSDVAEGLAEATPLRPERRDTEDLDEDTYGPLKVACENDIRDRFGDRATIVRATKVAGPHDPSGSVLYWVRRGARGGRVALPGDPSQPLALVDARDLAVVVREVVARGWGGAVDASGPHPAATLGEFITTCASAAGSTMDIVTVDPGLGGPMFPLVRAPSVWPVLRGRGALARSLGMPSTPLSHTVSDIAEWDAGRGAPPIDVGFDVEEERRLLESGE
ncbi:NAD-dependent epimerase/dehydratase family protein [Stackebrandtia soli]|uniref:NAD-dependent epimerase/dehydratase family protein n=1 Tax=Stackebrandtia soli TaxID=1892856 RepID=UPI0039ECEA1A